MSVTVYRIATDTKSYAADDLSGTGAKNTGGRWNSSGVAMVYTSTTRALACLETVVHLAAGGLPLNRYLVEIVISDAVWARAQKYAVSGLPVGWDAEPGGRVSIGLGDSWVASSASALLIVASVIVFEEFNILINPAHPDSAAITATKTRKWLYDPRLNKIPVTER